MGAQTREEEMRGKLQDRSTQLQALVTAHERVVLLAHPTCAEWLRDPTRLQRITPLTPQFSSTDAA